MTRYVVSREQVAHLWANKAQDTAREPKESSYFNGPTLYSYGWHYVTGHFLGDTKYILINSYRYSNMTADHQSACWSALSATQKQNVIEIPGMNSDAVYQADRWLREKKFGELPTIGHTLRNAYLVAMQNALTCTPRFAAYRVAARRAADMYKELVKVCKIYRVKCDVPDPAPLMQADAPFHSTHEPKWSPDLTNAVMAARRKLVLNKALREYMQGELANQNSKPGSRYYRNDRNPMAQAQQDVTDANDLKKWYLHKAEQQRVLVKSDTSPLYLSWLKAAKKSVDEMAEKKRELLRQEAREQAKIAEGHIARSLIHHSKAKTLKRYVTQLQANGRGSYNLLEELRDKPDLLPPGWLDRHGWFLDKAVTKLKGERIDRKMREFNTAMADADRNLQRLREAVEEQGTYTVGQATSSHHTLRQHIDSIRRHVNDLRRMQAGEGGLTDNQRDWIGREMVGNRGDEVIEHLAVVQAAADELIVKLNAGRIERWKAGETNDRPMGVTLARVKGDIVQTSIGADVPLDHAIRLARIVRRMLREMKAAGVDTKKWDGDGPMVGYFRVNEVTSDARVTIGCHVFESAESNRMMDLLLALPQAEKETADVQ